MKLAKDEVIGLLVAALIGGGALGLHVYRQARASAPPSAAAPQVDLQEARDAFAASLDQAFHDDDVRAVVVAEDTVLEVRWTACSKPMLKKLLDKTGDALTRNVRKLSGLSLAKLKALGFTKIVCDDTGGRVVTEKL